MNWYWYSLAGGCCSAFYFFNLKILLKDLPPTVLLMFIEVVMALTMLSTNFITKQTYTLTSKHVIMIVFAGVVVAFGTVLGAKGISKAPSPGLAQAVLTSYIVILYLASGFLLNAPLTARGGLGIACVVFGIALIVV